MGWDDKDPDTLCFSASEVAVFASRDEAKAAVRRSQLLSQLKQSRGEINNSDWTDKNVEIKILPLKAMSGKK
jgi:hypothetical protein